MIGTLVGLLLPSPIGRIRNAVRGQVPGGYTAAMPAQSAFVDAGAVVGMQSTIVARVGSEDWRNQLAAGARSEGPALPAVTRGLRSRVPWPVGMFTPNLPGRLIEGRGTGYYTGAYPKGWINVSQAGEPSWGASSGIASSRPNVQRDRINEPTFVTPAPQKVADTYAAENQGHTRLTDLFGD